MVSVSEGLRLAMFIAPLATGVSFVLILYAGWLVQSRDGYHHEFSRRKRYWMVAGGQLLMVGAVIWLLSQGSLDDIMAVNRFYWSAGLPTIVLPVAMLLIPVSPAVSAAAAWYISRDQLYRHLDGYW